MSCALLLAVTLASGEAPAVTVREPLTENVSVALRNGRVLFLECSPPPGDAAKSILGQYLAEPDHWAIYADKGAVAIPFQALNDKTRRAALLAVFREDEVDDRGWLHRVTYADGRRGQETLWVWCEWLTGKGTNLEAVMRVNGLKHATLRQGQEILFPRTLLLDIMKAPTPRRVVLEEPDPFEDLGVVAKGLAYEDWEGRRYAVYRLKEGEALYTAVVVRFTDFEDNESILQACDVVQKASGIEDVRAMKPGTKIRIPVELVSDRFKPEDNPVRRHCEAMIQEARRLQRQQVRTKDLAGVVVVLDAGHGGRDHGASNEKHSLYEDEINYDIVCRIRQILERDTDAKVHITSRDASQGYAPVAHAKFAHDTDEYLLTTPNYQNHDAIASANLRWFLANAIYRRELAAGADARKMVFTSVHCDALFDGRLRGAMIYIPGAKLRRDREGDYSSALYERYAEVREQPYATSSAQERQRDEALSRNFAVTFLDELGKKRIKRHKAGDPIRSQIRRTPTKVFVPAVLRNTMIPTKVLIECANMTNETDCTRVADPQWRQWFADANVNALKTYFGSS